MFQKMHPGFTIKTTWRDENKPKKVHIVKLLFLLALKLR